MSKNKTLTKDDVLHLAKLSNLQTNDVEVEKYKEQFGETLSYIENLKELNTDAVKETNQTIELSNVTFVDGETCTRMLTQEEALSNSKNRKGKNFIVKRIIG